jgi:hypothetical protein
MARLMTRKFLTDSERRRVNCAMGTVAHNKAFTVRELEKYSGVRPLTTYVRRLADTGMLTREGVAPVRYFPTEVMWERIRVDCEGSDY